MQLRVVSLNLNLTPRRLHYVYNTVDHLFVFDISTAFNRLPQLTVSTESILINRISIAIWMSSVRDNCLDILEVIVMDGLVEKICVLL